MSGRSAFARAQKEKQADQHYLRTRHGGLQSPDHYYGNIDAQAMYDHRRRSVDSLPSPTSQPTLSIDPRLYGYPQQQQQQQQQRPSGGPYAYGPQPPRQPRPIVIASAIEKSDFRTHLDGITDSVRGKLGRFMGVSKEKEYKRPESKISNRRASVTISPTPSAHAVPCLIPSLPPPAKALPFAARPSSGTQARPGSHEEGFPSVGVFQGGGKTVFRDWKSHLAVRAEAVYIDTGTDRKQAAELMDPKGDTLIQLFSDRRDDRPAVTFRVRSEVLREAGCKTILDQLHDTSNPQAWRVNESYYEDGGSVPGSASSNSQSDPKSDSTAPDSDSPQTPDVDTTWGPHSSPNLRFKLKLVYPGDRIGLDATSWLLTMRNFFAVLYGADTLCGTSLFEALRSLSARIREQHGWLDPNTDRTAFLLDFLTRCNFDDVRASSSNAASILAFSELTEVRWKAGYAEAFAHCVGLFNAGMSGVPEWKLLSPRSRIFVENAALEADPRIRRAQKLLHDFSFPDIWAGRDIPAKSQARAAFERFRQWLCAYCAMRTSGSVWPPPPNQRGLWLTRDRLVMLRELFCSLFDYLVDHDKVFDDMTFGVAEAPPDTPGERHWAIVSRAGGFFRADLGPELPVTSILTSFDDTHSFTHLPAPYPLLPEPVSSAINITSTGSVFSSPAHSKSPSASTSATAVTPTAKRGKIAPGQPSLSPDALLQRKALAYVDASNLYTATALCDATADFNAFERADRLGHVEPRAARIGRWMLVYAALQALSIVAVDTPGLKFADGVAAYHLNASLRGVVPWHAAGEGKRIEPVGSPARWGPDGRPTEPRPELFHPFTQPRTWPGWEHRLSRPTTGGSSAGSVFGSPSSDGRARSDVAPRRPRELSTARLPPLPGSFKPADGRNSPLATRANANVIPASTKVTQDLEAARAPACSQAPEPPLKQRVPPYRARPALATRPADNATPLASHPPNGGAASSPTVPSPRSPSTPGSDGATLLGDLRRSTSQGLLAREGGRGGLASHFSASSNGHSSGPKPANGSIKGGSGGPASVAAAAALVGDGARVRAVQVDHAAATAPSTPRVGQVPTTRELMEREQERSRTRRAKVQALGLSNFKPPAGW